MAAVTCTARLRKNGAISLPREVREQLQLQPGDQVELRVEKAGHPGEIDENPLYGIIGIAKGGMPDGSENHDAYLYRKDPV